MEDLCSICMCNGRKLYFIGDSGFYILYTQILNEIPVYDLSQIPVRICWECRSLLFRFHKFKSQVKHSYMSLLKHSKELTTPMPSQPHLQIQLVTHLTYPALRVKTERIEQELTEDPEDSEVTSDHGHIQLQVQVEGEAEVKSEQEPEHCEPETFVNNLELERPKRKCAAKVPRNEKSNKEKPKNELKETKTSKFTKKTTVENKERRVSTDTYASDVSLGQSVMSDTGEDMTDSQTDVTNSQTDVTDSQMGVSLKTTSKPSQPHLQVQLVTQITYPELRVKTERIEQEAAEDTEDSEVTSDQGHIQLQVQVEGEAEVKSEQEPEHCEPETFVNNLELKRPKRKRAAKVPRNEKPTKGKPKKKLKETKQSKLKKTTVENKKRRLSTDTYASDVSLGQSVISDTGEDVTNSQTNEIVKDNVSLKPTKGKPKKKLKETKQSKLKKTRVENKKRRVSTDTYASDVSFGQSVMSDTGESVTNSQTDEIVKDNVSLKPTKEKPKKKLKETKQSKLKKTRMENKKRRASTDTYASDISFGQSVMSDTGEGVTDSQTDEIVKDNVNLKAVSKVNGKVNKAPRKVKQSSKDDKLPEKPQCGECGKMFCSMKTLRYHLIVLHKGQNRYPCPQCGKVYQWRSNLSRHVRSHKARDSDELYCEMCDKRFASVATYRNHLRLSRRHVTESEFRFICNDCGKKFVSKAQLRDHIDWEHLKNIKFKCQMCSKPCKSYSSLYVHIVNVHKNKEKKDILCHVCGKGFPNATKLNYHIVAMHTSETPYQCTQCTAAFGWYSSLYRHIREVHYKMKPKPKPKKAKNKTAKKMKK